MKRKIFYFAAVGQRGFCIAKRLAPEPVSESMTITQQQKLGSMR
jgi:hypothetical protein